MAISSYNAKLMKKDGSTWTQVCPIKGIPQIGGEPEQIETTTLDDPVQTFIDGIQSQESMSMTNNYDLAGYKEIKALKGQELDLSIWLGNDGLGSQGKFTGKGKLDVYVNSAETNAAVEMTVVLTPTTAFELEDDGQTVNTQTTSNQTAGK